MTPPALRGRRPRALVWVHVARLAVDSIARNRLRSFLSALGVLAGVTALIAVQGLIGGVNTVFHNQLTVLGPNAIHLTRQPLLNVGPGPSTAGWPPIRYDEALHLQEHLTTAQAVIPSYTHNLAGGAQDSGLEVGGERLPSVEVIGATEAWIRLGRQLSEGRFLTALEAGTRRPVAVVGADIFRRMRERGLRLGDEVLLQGEPLQVIGVVEARGVGLYGSLDNFVIIPLERYEHTFGRERSMIVSVLAADPHHVSATVDELVGALRAYRRLTPDQENDFTVNLPEELLALYRRLTFALYATTTALALIALLVSGGGILNIMLVAVTERTREIGVLRALGARPSTILGQFLIEAMLLSGTGALGGLLMGALIVLAISAVTPLPAHVSFPTLALGLGYGLLAGVLFAFLPALRASRLLPAEALRAR